MMPSYRILIDFICFIAYRYKNRYKFREERKIISIISVLHHGTTRGPAEKAGLGPRKTESNVLRGPGIIARL